MPKGMQHVRAIGAHRMRWRGRRGGAGELEGGWGAENIACALVAGVAEEKGAGTGDGEKRSGVAVVTR